MGSSIEARLQAEDSPDEEEHRTWTRAASHAGEWYPSDTETLTKWMDASLYYAQCDKSESENVVAIIAPHSIYEVCLRTAWLSYSRVNPDNYDRVVILGTCHHVLLAGAMVSSASALSTPYGEFEVDSQLNAQLLQAAPDLVSVMDEEVDVKEFSIEQQLPILKYLFQSRPVKVLPVLVGCLSEGRETQLSEIFRPIITAPRTLTVVSSDFTHWGRRFNLVHMNPNTPLVDQLRVFDERAFGLITVCNYTHFRLFFEENGGAICGCRAICLLMRCLAGGHEGQVCGRKELCPLKKVTDWSVSYAAIVFRKVESRAFSLGKLGD